MNVLFFGKMMQDHTKEEIFDLLHQELRIVFLQVETLGKDVDTHIFDDLGRVTYHENVDQLDVISLCKDADIVITNKNLFRKVEIDRCPYLKMILCNSHWYKQCRFRLCKKKKELSS